MPSIGDVYQLTLDASYLGQKVNNVFLYRINDAPTETAAEGLATEFIADVLPLIAGIQDDSLTYNGIKVVNLFDPADLYEEPLTLAGFQSCVAVTASSPSFLAIHTKLIRDNARVDNGAKYWAGLCENFLSENTVVGLDAPLAALDASLIANLTAGGVDTFVPVLVKRVRSTANRTNTFGQLVSYYRYRLPTSQAEMSTNFSPIRAAQSSKSVSHMLSRQVGRGV